jgi:hypothetical protein
MLQAGSAIHNCGKPRERCASARTGLKRRMVGVDLVSSEDTKAWECEQLNSYCFDK